MRALVYVAPGKVEMQDRPRPAAQADEEEIAIEFAGACGSDISWFLCHSALRKPLLVLGHELVGRLRDGRRVVANPLLSCGRCTACLSGALLGMTGQRSELNFVASIRKEHRVVMSFAYTPPDFRRSLDLLIAGEVDLRLWTVRMPLESGQQALEKMSHDPGVSLKMMLQVAETVPH